MAVKIDLVNRTVALGVGDLVTEPLVSVARVAGIRMWTRMALGREAHVRHQTTQAELHDGYAREMFVRYGTMVDEFGVTIQGRVDGVLHPRNGGAWIIEEIKSVVLPPLVFAALEVNSHPHYVEQLRLYCFFVEREQHNVVGRLVFVNVADATTKTIELHGPFDDCEALIVARVRALIANAFDEERRRQQRRERARALRFPHIKPRKYQDAMTAAVERALQEGRHLMVSAPSGIGKTVGALYPAVSHALANDRRVFFITAKNTQQRIALDTLRNMSMPTAVAFRAREQMCVNDTYACREEFCQHLRDFKSKLETTRVLERLLGERIVLPDAMMESGRDAKLCPFEIALLEAERTDVIVCDYNYVFDPQVYFRRFFQDADYSDAILIIDEAHNLLQRAMDYYSPTLRRGQVLSLMKNLRHVEPKLAKEIKGWLSALDDFFVRTATRRGDEYTQVEDYTRSDEQMFLIESPRASFDDLKPEFTRLSIRYFLDKINSGRVVADDPIEEFFSAFGQFCGVLATEGEEFSYVFDAAADQAVEIVCKDPSRFLAERLDGFHSVIAMSATLAPMQFYRQMLGFDEKRTDQLSLPSPFPPENRRILVVPSVSTTFRYRAANYEKIAQIIATTVSARRGNYMALFPSYEFMRSVAQLLPPGNWDLKVQSQRMTEAERQALVDSLKENDPPKLVLAVQGGLFAEGVDYPGEMLSGVIVVSPALPQVSFERELMRRYYQQHYDKGFEFAYLYPGMSRVIQSVGRLIRSEMDRGVAVLVCRRFADGQYSTLFPRDWSDDEANSLVTRDLKGELSQFWSSVSD